MAELCSAFFDIFGEPVACDDRWAHTGKHIGRWRGLTIRWPDDLGLRNMTEVEIEEEPPMSSTWKPTDDEIAAFVARTRRSSGVPERLEDPVAASEIAEILWRPGESTE